MREIRFRAWDKNANLWDEGPVLYIHTSGGLLNFSEDVIFMQYTGFKDCKGKDIYEGDIVNIVSSIAAEVYWDYGAWQLRNGDKAGGQLGSVMAMDDKVQVIGNIYEHAGLLEKG